MLDNQQWFKNSAKNVEKSPEKIWKSRFFAVTLHSVSRLNGCEALQKGS